MIDQCPNCNYPECDEKKYKGTYAPGIPCQNCGRTFGFLANIESINVYKDIVLAKFDELPHVTKIGYFVVQNKLPWKIISAISNANSSETSVILTLTPVGHDRELEPGKVYVWPV